MARSTDLARHLGVIAKSDRSWICILTFNYVRLPSSGGYEADHTVMFPFAHSCDDFPPDAEVLMEAGLGVAKAMRTVHGEGYQSGQACDLTYR